MLEIPMYGKVNLKKLFSISNLQTPNSITMAGKHYNNKFKQRIIGTLKKNGFICEELPRSKNKYSISREGGELKIVHSGLDCYHPLRKWLKSVYNFDLEDY